MESKARISINTKTGERQFHYNKGSTPDMNNVKNSDGLVNFIRDSNGLELAEPIRPSNIIWQMPYEDRKSFI